MHSFRGEQLARRRRFRRHLRRARRARRLRVRIGRPAARQPRHAREMRLCRVGGERARRVQIAQQQSRAALGAANILHASEFVPVSESSPFIGWDRRVNSGMGWRGSHRMIFARCPSCAHEIPARPSAACRSPALCHVKVSQAVSHALGDFGSDAQ